MALQQGVIERIEVRFRILASHSNMLAFISFHARCNWSHALRGEGL